MKLAWLCIKVRKFNRKFDVGLALEACSDFEGEDPLEKLYMKDHSKRKKSLQYKHNKKACA